MAKLYGVGVGTGDPELLTLKAVRVLSESDIVILPRARTKSYSTAHEIVRQYLKDDTRLVFMDFSTMDNDQGRQEDRKAYSELVNKVIQEDKILSFVTIGDPMTLSTFVYVMQQLDQNIEVECIPGITSFASVCSRLKTPLLMGDESLKIVPLYKDCDIAGELDSAQNIVFMKISRNLEALKKALQSKGLLDKAVIVSNCGKADEKIIYNINHAGSEDISYFSTMLVKKNGLVRYRGIPGV